jgi:hypothetical protein
MLSCAMHEFKAEPLRIGAEAAHRLGPLAGGSMHSSMA